MTTPPDIVALWRYAHEHPDDDTARLVLADAVQEAGDEARAELIRVQVELSRCGPCHKRPTYEYEATALTALGDRHYQ